MREAPSIVLTTTGWDPGLKNRLNRKDVAALIKEAEELLGALRQFDQHLIDTNNVDEIFPFKAPLR